MGAVSFDFFTGSPGHPEEVCAALLFGVLVSTCYLSERPSIWTAFLLGALIAALALTKMNIGCYITLATGLALLKASSGGHLQKQPSRLFPLPDWLYLWSFWARFFTVSGHGHWRSSWSSP